MLRERLLTMRGLPSDATNVLETEPGKLYIKRRKPVILFISLPSDVMIGVMSIQRHWRRDSKSATSSWPDKGTCLR